MGARYQKGSAIKRRGSWMLFGLLGSACALWLLVRWAAPAPEIERLSQLLQEVERQTAGYKPDRSQYPLPGLEQGLAEVAYLESLERRMALGQADCPAAEAELLELYREYAARRGPSIFLSPARSLARREGQDFVQRSSESIRGGAGIGLRPRLRQQETLNPDLALELLREKMALAQMLERAVDSLASSVKAAEDFASACPNEASVLDEVLGYFLLRPGA